MYTCRICRVSRSMKTKGYTELKHHFESTTHLQKDQRVRLSIRGAPVYDKNLMPLNGSELLKVKNEVMTKYPDVPVRLPVRLLVGQSKLPCCETGNEGETAIVTQTMMLSKLLLEGGNLELLETLWNFFCESTLHTATHSSLDWSHHRILVSISFIHVFILHPV